VSAKVIDWTDALVTTSQDPALDADESLAQEDAERVRDCTRYDAERFDLVGRDTEGKDVDRLA
jgi:hypothetical protein